MHQVLAKISLESIRRNALLIKRRAGTSLIAVVKDDAYGHGAEAVAHALEQIADAFAVSSAEEGIALRVAGVAKEILVLTPALCLTDAVRLAQYRLTGTVSSLSSLNLLKRAQDIAGAPIAAHLAVNTGMNRYGVRLEHVPKACCEMGDMLCGIYSHLYAPDLSGDAAEQEAIFEQAVLRAKQTNPELMCHLCATGGVLSGSVRMNLDAVRAGISLYGYTPAGFGNALGLRPAMRVYATVSHAATHLGKGLGYMRARRPYKKVHTMRVGYGDGFFRAGGLGSEGALCMDAAVFEGGARFGTRKLLIGDMEAYARANGTTVYETLVSIGSRAEKIYV